MSRCHGNTKKKIFARLFKICRYDWRKIQDEEDKSDLESEMEELLKTDIDINVPNQYFKSSLLLCDACRMGNKQVVQILLENGADVNVCDGVKCSPLYIASSNGHVQVVELLLKANADVNCKNVTGYMPLLSAVENDNIEAAERLVLAGADVNISRPNTFGVEMTLLVFVLFVKNNIPFADILLNAGVIPHKFQKPLNYLLLDGSNECRTFLQKLIYSGFNLHCTDWIKMTKAKINQKLVEVSESEKDMLEFLEKESKEPARLERCCRTVIRTSLVSTGRKPATHLQKKVELLPIPQNLKRFLLLEFL